MNTRKLILASTSRYRQELLRRLDRPFEALAPLIDEEKEKDPRLEPQALAEKLALLKAKSLAGPGKIVIGGDQLVSFQGQVLGKPHSKNKAVEQLLSMQGQSHELVTAVCVFVDEKPYSFTDITVLEMKPLSRLQLERYVDLDEPLDCAGSYKIEKHGISLFKQIHSQDFTAIQGLPLIALGNLLDTLDL
jgi:septum formation protein